MEFILWPNNLDHLSKKKKGSWMQSKLKENLRKKFVVVSIILILLALSTVLLLIKAHYEGKRLIQDAYPQNYTRQ